MVTAEAPVDMGSTKRSLRDNDKICHADFGEATLFGSRNAVSFSARVFAEPATEGPEGPRKSFRALQRTDPISTSRVRSRRSEMPSRRLTVS